jgi:hypothetical protein
MFIDVKKMKLFEIKNNFETADFWLINKGSSDKLGLPVKEFKPYLTGVKCSELIYPFYAYYLCLHLHQLGVWGQYSQGTINLQHLRLSDINYVLNNLTVV